MIFASSQDRARGNYVARARRWMTNQAGTGLKPDKSSHAEDQELPAIASITALLRRPQNGDASNRRSSA